MSYGNYGLLYRFRFSDDVLEDSLSAISQADGEIQEVYRFGSRDSEWSIRWLSDGFSLLLASARDQENAECSARFTTRGFETSNCWDSFADLYLANYKKDGNLQFEKLTITPLSRCDFTWSPDGRRIAYVHGSVCLGHGVFDGSIRIFDFKTNADIGLIEDELTALNMNVNASPKWSPTGERLLFSSCRDCGYPELRITDLNGVETILRSEGYANSGSWSPNGRQVLWWDSLSNSIGVTDLESGSFRTWPLSSGFRYLLDPRGWSPDSRYFAFTGWANPGDEEVLYILNLASGAIVTWAQAVQALAGLVYILNLASGAIVTPAHVIANSLAWSPDGAWLAFAAKNPVEQNTCHSLIDFYIVKPDGTHLQNLTEGKKLRSLPCGPAGYGWRWYRENSSDLQWIP